MKLTASLISRPKNCSRTCSDSAERAASHPEAQVAGAVAAPVSRSGRPNGRPKADVFDSEWRTQGPSVSRTLRGGSLHDATRSLAQSLQAFEYGQRLFGVPRRWVASGEDEVHRRSLRQSATAHCAVRP